MARELDVTIKVDDGGAKETLAGVDADLARVGERALSTGTGVAKLEAIMAAARLEYANSQKELKQLVQTFSTASDTARQQLGPEIEQAAHKMVEARAQVASLSTELKKHASVTKEASGEVDKFVGMIDRVVERLAIYASAEAVLGAVESTIAFGTQIRNLSLQTGIGTDALQVLNLVSAEYGVTTGELANSISTLSRRLAGDDSSATRSMMAMGLSVDSLKAMAPEQFFVQVAAAIGQIENPTLRAQAAWDNFGRAGLAMLPALNKNIAEQIEHMKTLNLTMDPETIKALTAVDTAWAQLGTRTKVIIGESITGWAGLIGFIKQSALGLSGKAKEFLFGPEMLSDAFGKSGDAWFQQTQQQAKPAVAAPPLSPDQMGQNLLSGLTARALRELTEVQKKYLEQLFDIGQLNTQNAAVLGVTVEQLDIFKKKEEETITAQARLSEELREGKRLYGEIMVSGVKATDALNLKTQEWLRATMDVKRELMDTQRVLAEQQRTAGIAADPGLAAATKRDAALMDVQAKQRAYSDIDFSPTIQKIWQEFDDELKKASVGLTGASAAANGLTKSHAGAIQAGEALTTAFGAFSGRVEAMSATINLQTGQGTVGTDPRILNYMSMGYTQGEAMALISGSTNVMIGAPHRASGGWTSAGMSYWVGEKGPELFTPQSSGTISPTGSGGAPSIGDIHIHGNVDSELRARQTAREIADEVMRRLKQTGARQRYTT